MIKSNSKNRFQIAAVCLFLGLGICSSTGCQVRVAGQPLPSATYLDPGVQYFPAVPGKKQANETAPLNAAKADAATGR